MSTASSSNKGRDEADAAPPQAGLFDDAPSVSGDDPSRIDLSHSDDASPKAANKAEGLATPKTDAKATRAKSKGAKRETAQSMATRQREISVSEFFAKNRHLLGFDNPARALLTAVKEAVDNSLDACEEGGILPEVLVKLEQVEEDRFRITIEDNGPGIVKAQVPKVFGKLLYGSKFHRCQQSRGQQGIGISAAAMYGQLTTGKPIVVISKTGRQEQAHHYELAIDTKKNMPEIIRERVTFWEKEHGTAVTIELEGSYKKGRRSVDTYIEQTALANPHARLEYQPPKGELEIFERVSEDLPVRPKEIQPHPHGVELGVLARVLKESTQARLTTALQENFSRVSARVGDEICKVAGLSPKCSPRRLEMQECERLFRAIPKVKILSPPTNCLSPIGEDLIISALGRRVPEAEFVDACTRPPTVYRGNPFQVEAGLAYGGGTPGDQIVELTRLANRVPLQYQQSACAVTKGVMSVPWKNYQVQQSAGALPNGPLVLFAHVASVWVPFTSESKEAVASYDIILKEVKLAFMEIGRRLGIHLRKNRRRDDEMKKRAYIDAYLPHVGIALQQILGLSDEQKEETVSNLRIVMEQTRKSI
jgi:DNA topoisomerase-6 subunit B